MTLSAPRPIRIVLVDDHRSMLWGLEKLITSGGGDMEVVAKATSGTEALRAVEKHCPHLVLLDLDLGEESGLDILPQLCKHDETKVLVFTGLHDPEMHERALRGGACGLVHKSKPAEVILKAIEHVHAGEIWVDRGTVSNVFNHMSRANAHEGNDEPSAHAALTVSERRIVAAVVAHKGAPNKVIADALHISAHTLRNHLASIYSKLGIHHRLDLVLYALEHQLDENPGAPSVSKPAPHHRSLYAPRHSPRV